MDGGGDGCGGVGTTEVAAEAAAEAEANISRVVITSPIQHFEREHPHRWSEREREKNHKRGEGEDRGNH